MGLQQVFVISDSEGVKNALRQSRFNLPWELTFVASADAARTLSSEKAGLALVDVRCSHRVTPPKGWTCALLIEGKAGEEIPSTVPAWVDDILNLSEPASLIQLRLRKLLESMASASNVSDDILDLIGKAVAHTSEGISIADLSLPGRPLIFVNEGFCRMTGYSKEEALGHNCRFLQGPDTDPTTVQALREALDLRVSFEVDILNYRKDRTPFWNRLVLSPIKDRKGEPRYFVGVQYDITELVKRDRQLQDRQRAEGHQAEYLKSMMNTGASEEQMKQILDMLHVRFNQDLNFSHLDKVARQPKELSNTTARIDRAAMGLVQEGLHSVARFSEGIQIAQKVTHSFPVFRTFTMAHFADWLNDFGAGSVPEIARHRKNDVQLWVDEDVSNGEGFLHIDPKLLGPVLDELVTNACKYSDNGDPVRVSVARNDRRIEFSVLNLARLVGKHSSGEEIVGIPDELSEFVFQYFVRFSKTLFAEFQERWPIGLGLPLCREVIRRHGGELLAGNAWWHMNPFGSSSAGSVSGPTNVVNANFYLPIMGRPVSNAPVQNQIEEELDVDLF